MSETVRGDESMPPTIGPGSSSFEVKALEIYETSSATTTDDIEFNQNYNDDDGLTDEDDDLPSLRDILERKGKRNPEVIDLTVEDDVDSSLSLPPTPAPEKAIAQMLLAPAISPVITPPQIPSPTQPSSSSTTCMAGTTSWVVQTPRKTLFKNIPSWSAFRDEPLQISARTAGLGASEAAELVVQTEGGSESDSDVAGVTMQHSVLLDEHSDAADKVRRVAHSANPTRTEDNATGSPTFDTAPHLSTGNADLLEIPETPSVTEEMRCPVHPSVVRVMGKRLNAERPRYLVLCWMHPPEGEAAHSDLDRRFREYDEKISRVLARQKRLSTLRSRKHYPADDHESRPRKRPKTLVTASASQNHSYPSRQVEEDFFLDSDVHSVDLSPIYLSLP